MYSQLSMAREISTNDCKPLGTHRTLCLVSRIDELKLMEGDPLKGEHYRISHHSTRGTKYDLDDLEEIRQRTCSQTKTLCIFHVCQVQAGHEKDPLNSNQ
jgi:hypothetical protein